MKKKNELLRSKLSTTINGAKADFCWVFLPNGDFIQIHEDTDYCNMLNMNYESKSNQPL